MYLPLERRKKERKNKERILSSSGFNNNNVLETNRQMYLRVILNICLSFEDHLETLLNKVNKAIGLLHKLQNILPKSVLLTIYKAFFRPHLDYSDIMYNQAYDAVFHQN